MRHPAPPALDKDVLKALRQERKQWIEAAAAASRESKKALAAVRERLARSSATVPEISEATGLPTDKTLWLIATMKKFGEIAERESVDGYYRYALLEIAAEDAADPAHEARRDAPTGRRVPGFPAPQEGEAP